MSEPWSRLMHQSRSRELTAEENAFAQALESIFSQGVADYAEVVRLLTERAVVAPTTRRTDWDIALLVSELETANRSLDEAYARHGIGA